MQKEINSIAQKFGTLLGISRSVPAYSSDYDTADDAEYPRRSSFRSYADGIYMGYKWQCVEYARRWLYTNCGYIFADVSMAYEIFNMRSVREIATNTLLPLQAFGNGSLRHPVAGSLLIWDEGGEFERTGHVAIITEILPDRVRLAEQNVDHKLWPAGCDYSREIPVSIGEAGDFWLQCSYDDASILGWMIQTEDATHAEPTETDYPGLLNLVMTASPDRGQAGKPWLNIANADEAAYVKMMRGHKLTSVDEDQYRYFQVSKTALEKLENATDELHGMFMHATDYVLQHEKLLENFCLPKAVLSKIRQSWDNRLNQLITSRFDFSLSEHGIKVYEYNCDSASCYMECGKVQGKWGEHFDVEIGDDAGEKLFRDLVKAWQESEVSGLIHILQDDDPEEDYHAQFMCQVIRAADIPCRIIRGLQSLHWDNQGQIRDSDNNEVQWVWKTWAWETALDQIRDEIADDQLHGEDYEPAWTEGSTPRLVDVLLRKGLKVFEPLWTLIPSNKAILPVLWALFPNHPLLLNSSFELTGELKATGYVVKPIVGRCGHNIQLIDSKDQLLEGTGGQFANRSNMYQQLFPLPKLDKYFVQVSTFTAAGNYSGSIVRVDTSMIINKDSDCMALRVVDDAFFIIPA